MDPHRNKYTLFKNPLCFVLTVTDRAKTSGCLNFQNRIGVSYMGQHSRTYYHRTRYPDSTCDRSKSTFYVGKDYRRDYDFGVKEPIANRRN